MTFVIKTLIVFLLIDRKHYKQWGNEMSLFSFFNATRKNFSAIITLLTIALAPAAVLADSVNSPNITLNVDTNRSTGAGAGNVSVTVNTITIAEISLPEYSAGSGKQIVLKARPGFQFDPTSTVSAQCATFGINGGGVGSTASIVPAGTANETLTFALTSGNGNNSNVQDIIRVNGIKLKILSAAGAAGPAQTTMLLTTASVGGAFTDQGIVAATISRGVADHLEFSLQPGNNQAAGNLLPQVKIADFGGNVVPTDSRTISLALQTNPGSATLLGTTSLTSSSGIAAWAAGNNLNITTAAAGYTLRASHSGASFLTSNTVDSAPFTISAGNPGKLEFTTQPVDTSAGSDILLAVRVLDEFDNPNTTTPVDVSIDASVNPGGWPLLVDTSLTKTTSSGVASWSSADNLRINKAVSDYRIAVSGLGAPVNSNTFDITPGSANSVRFLQSPVNVVAEDVMVPSPSAEIIDAFGNRLTDSTATVTLALAAPQCNGTLTGGSVAAVSGVATFSNVSLDSACSDVALQATTGAIVGAVSENFDVFARDAFPIALRAALLRRGKLFQFNAAGSFKISTDSLDDPTRRGAVLTVTGESGRARYVLPRAGWRKSGSGFRFSGAKCQTVNVQKSTLSASCEGRTGTIALPESNLSIVLEIGKGTERFCGECGGTSKADETKTFKRVACAKPLFCP